MSMDLTDDKSTLVQVVAWCRQATSHYLSQCWPSSMSLYDVTRPQWVKCQRESTCIFRCLVKQWCSNVSASERKREMFSAWWRHQMETFSALLASLWGESAGNRRIPLTKASDVELWCFFMCKILCKQSRRRWFKTPSLSLWRHCNEHSVSTHI